jgi:hypothetical protein
MAGWNAHQEREVVLENQGMHWLRGDVDHMRLRIAQPNQQKQQPLLVEGRADQLLKLVLIQGERRDDDGRRAPVIAGRQGAPDLRKAWLEQLEGGKFLVERQVAGERRLGNHVDA